MDSRYLQLSPEDQLVEECAELILAVQKLKRFGKQAVDPYTAIKYDNLKAALDEMHDVQNAITKCAASWSETE